MKLPEKKWLTINELAIRWNISKSDIFHYLETDTLNAHIKLKQATALFYLHHDDSGRITGQDYYHGIGMFMILNFDRVYWKNIEFTYVADLQKSNVIIAREKKAFSFRQPFCIFHDDLLILMNDIKKFEEDQDAPSMPDENSQDVLPLPDNCIKLPTDSTGREMLPLRLIPFITNGNTGPERLALVLAEKGDLSGYKEIDAQGKLKAYRLLDGNLICMKRAEWDDHLHAIQSLRESCEQKHKDYTKWRLKALKLLPPAFVWRDEFEKAHSHSMLPDDHEQQELNWYPCFPEDIDTAFLMKVGTESPAADIEQTEKPVNAPPVTSFLNPAPDPCHLVTKTLEQLTVPLAPAAEVEERVKSKTEKIPVNLLLPNKKERFAQYSEQAQKLLDNGSTRREAAEKIKEAGAVLEQIGQILTSEGSENRTRDAWEKRAVRLLGGKLKGFV